MDFLTWGKLGCDNSPSSTITCKGKSVLSLLSGSAMKSMGETFDNKNKICR